MDCKNHHRHDQRLALPLLLLTLGASAFWGCHHNIVQDGALDSQAIIETGRKISEVRQLSFLRPIRVRLVGSKDLEEMLAQDLGNRQSSGAADPRSKFLALMGLIPWGTNSAKIEASVLTQQPAGWYNPDTHSLEIFSTNMVKSELVETINLFMNRDLTFGEIVAHELTHALQDQHFGLRPPAGAEENQDLELAHAALVEGDATLAGFELGLGSLFTDAPGFIDFARNHAPAMDSRIPPYFVERFKFPYLEGATLVDRIRKAQGWQGVDRAYFNPPRSTEEVLHPEKYLTGSDPPLLPNLSDLANHPPSGFEWIYQDALGEFGIRVLLSSALGNREAEKAATGWGGDRAMLFQKTAREDLLLVWVVDWDTPADAAEFFDGFETVLNKKFGDPKLIRLDEMRWVSQNRDLKLEIWGNRVVFINTPLETESLLLLEKAWQAGSQRLEIRIQPPQSNPEKTLPPEQALEIDPTAPRHQSATPLVRIGTAGKSLTLGALLQVLAQRNQENGLSIQRMRARAVGQVSEMLNLGMRLQLELNGSEPLLLDAVISFSPVSPNLLYLGKLNFGRDKVPFSYSALLDPEELTLNFRPLSATELAPSRRTGFWYDLDLAHYAIPLHFRVGVFDGFPERNGLGPLAAVRLDFKPSDWIGGKLQINLGFAYLREKNHQDPLTLELFDLQGMAFDTELEWSGFAIEGEALLLDESAQGTFNSLGWSITASAFLLPDFLQLVARYDELHPEINPEVQQLTGGVNLYYLANRFRLTYNFIWNQTQDKNDSVKHLMMFQLML